MEWKNTKFLPVPRIFFHWSSRHSFFIFCKTTETKCILGELLKKDYEMIRPQSFFSSHEENIIFTMTHFPTLSTKIFGTAFSHTKIVLLYGMAHYPHIFFIFFLLVWKKHQRYISFVNHRNNGPGPSCILLWYSFPSEIYAVLLSLPLKTIVSRIINHWCCRPVPFGPGPFFLKVYGRNLALANLTQRNYFSSSALLLRLLENSTKDSLAFCMQFCNEGGFSKNWNNGPKLGEKSTFSILLGKTGSTLKFSLFLCISENKKKMWLCLHNR